MPKPPIDSAPRDMFEGECLERYSEGLAFSVSYCNIMEKHEPNRGWKQIGDQLMGVRLNGIKKSKQKPITRGALLQDAAIIQRGLDTSAQT